MFAHYFASKKTKFVVISETNRPEGQRIAVSGKAEARTKLDALAGGNGEHQVGQLAFDAVKPWFADTGGQPGDDGLQNAADTVTLAARSADGRLHGLLF